METPRLKYPVCWPGTFSAGSLGKYSGQKIKTLPVHSKDCLDLPSFDIKLKSKSKILKVDG